MIELNSEKQNATRRLKGKVEALELQSYKAISQISDVVMERLEGRLDAVASFQEIEETGNSITRSEIDKWRQEVQKYLVQLPSKVSSLQVEVSQDFVEQLRESISATMNLDLKISVAEIEDDLSAKTYADEYLDNITKQREELLKDIEDVQQELLNSGENIPELETNSTPEAVQALHYEPVYDK